MKRTDFSVDWLFAACAPDTELLPWNAQFTPVDLPHDWQIRHADDLYRDGTLFYRKYFFVTDVPGTRRMLWFGGAYMDTTVFVNGNEVGQWKYGYTSYKEQIEYETIEADIEKLENRLSEIYDEMVKNATNFGKLNELTKEKEDLEGQLMEKMERWEYLEDLAQKIANLTTS